MSATVGVIKRHGARQTEAFAPHKLHASIVAACLSVNAPEGHAHLTADRVLQGVVAWCKNKSEVTSADIRQQAAALLDTYHPEAAYLYHTHQMIM